MKTLKQKFAPASMSMLAILMCAVMVTVPMVGCGADQVIAGLSTAQTVATQAQKILAPSNPEIANIAGVVATDLGVIIKAYQDYDVATGSDKPTKAALVHATAAAITNNLSAILAAVQVKNPKLLTEITIFVAVANSAVTVLLTKVPASAAPVVTAQSAQINTQALPVITGAKSAKDLKKAWNNAVAKSFPKEKI